MNKTIYIHLFSYLIVTCCNISDLHPSHKNHNFQKRYALNGFRPTKICQASYEGTLDQFPDSIIKKALQAGPNQAGDTLLHLACDKNTAQLILNQSENPQQLMSPNYWGCSPLHQLSFRDNPEVVECILIWLAQHNQLEKEINRPTAYNREKNRYFADTPAHIATARHNFKTLAVLRKYGAKLNIENNQKETPYDIALRLNILTFYREAIHPKPPLLKSDTLQKQTPLTTLTSPQSTVGYASSQVSPQQGSKEKKDKKGGNHSTTLPMTTPSDPDEIQLLLLKAQLFELIDSDEE